MLSERTEQSYRIEIGINESDTFFNRMIEE